MSLSPVEASNVRTNTESSDGSISPNESSGAVIGQVFSQSQSGRAETSSQWQTPESVQMVTFNTANETTSKIDTQRERALPSLSEQKIPFQKIKFECLIPWGPETPDRDQTISRHMKFQSVTSNSSVNSLEVFGFKDNSITIGLSSKHRKDFEKCAKHFGLTCFSIEEEGDKAYVCIAKEKENQLAILACLTDHNEIPKDHLNFLNKLVEAQNWSTLEQEQKSTSSSSSSTQTEVVSTLAESVQEEFPYPGEPAIFECTQPWASNKGEFRRFMRFQSITDISLIDVVDILGFDDGSITIYISIKHPNTKHFHHYFLGLKMHRLTNEDGDYTDSYRYRSSQENPKEVLICLVQNNTLPSEQLPFLIQLIEKQNWRIVEEENKKPAIDQLS